MISFSVCIGYYIYVQHHESGDLGDQGSSNYLLGQESPTQGHGSSFISNFERNLTVV